jgi:hypothetical protein
MRHSLEFLGFKKRFLVRTRIHFGGLQLPPVHRIFAKSLSAPICAHGCGQKAAAYGSTMPRKTARSMANRNTHLERSSLFARYVDFLFVPLLVGFRGQY